MPASLINDDLTIGENIYTQVAIDKDSSLRKDLTRTLGEPRELLVVNSKVGKSRKRQAILQFSDVKQTLNTVKGTKTSEKISVQFKVIWDPDSLRSDQVEAVNALKVDLVPLITADNIAYLMAGGK